MPFEVGEGFLSVFGCGLLLEQKDRQGPEQGKIARGGAIAHRAAVLVLGAIPAIVLPIFDAPMVAGQLQQGVGPGLLRPLGGHGKTDVVRLLDHLALAHGLRVAADPHDLSHAG